MGQIYRPIIFAHHGYPSLIHKLAYRRTNYVNLRVRGYKEEGTTTTPFDMAMRSGSRWRTLGCEPEPTPSRTEKIYPRFGT